MPRVVSFFVLLGIVLVVGAVLFRVMAPFLLPLFLAVVLVVLFKPLHMWFLERCRGYNRAASGLTALAILLIVLLPLTIILFRAASEGVTVAHNIHKDTLAKKAQETVDHLRHLPEKFGFDPIPEESLPMTVEAIIDAAYAKLEPYLAPAALGGLKFVTGILVSLAIMVVALYYFLADGPVMVNTLMRLSPLDDRYERELLDQFAKVSRAVVLAALLSALVQGILAGIGYYFAGLQAVFLLMAVTMLFALVPFVGSAAVWVPCSLWVYLFNGHLWTAIALAIYCGLIVSTSDNIIKPLVLHGQSGIHPLFALLSILGGVTALGPIGILVGPMLVAFLQALLSMLNMELRRLGAAQK